MTTQQIKQRLQHKAWATRKVRVILRRAFAFAASDPAILVRDTPLTPSDRQAMAAQARRYN